jgi:hypothetical protein
VRCYCGRDDGEWGEDGMGRRVYKDDGTERY